MFQHALLKALFHNITMTTLIERARTFLYMQLVLLHSNTLDHAPPFHMFKRVSCLPGMKQPTQKKDAHHVHTCIYH